MYLNEFPTHLSYKTNSSMTELVNLAFDGGGYRKAIKEEKDSDNES